MIYRRWVGYEPAEASLVLVVIEPADVGDPVGSEGGKDSSDVGVGTDFGLITIGWLFRDVFYYTESIQVLSCICTQLLLLPG